MTKTVMNGVSDWNDRNEKLFKTLLKSGKRLPFDSSAENYYEFLPRNRLMY
jgi:hypothetical protein